MTSPFFKGAVLVAWLVVAAGCDREPRLRSVMAYVGAGVALVHVFAIAGAKIEEALRTPSRDGLDAPILGFVLGVAAGLLAGIPLGMLSSRSRAVYALVHVVAAAFVAFWPLVRL